MTESNQDVKKNNSLQINDLHNPTAKFLIYKEFIQSVILRFSACKKSAGNTHLVSHF
jgi:hypothetical protein